MITVSKALVLSVVMISGLCNQAFAESSYCSSTAKSIVEFAAKAHLIQAGWPEISTKSTEPEQIQILDAQALTSYKIQTLVQYSSQGSTTEHSRTYVVRVNNRTCELVSTVPTGRRRQIPRHRRLAPLRSTEPSTIAGHASRRQGTGASPGYRGN